jgi:glycosyltransferase involved in cell wall biosynthesis
MRVAFVTETWLPSTDGIITRLTATVRELVRGGHDVLIVAPRAKGHRPSDADLTGATVRTVPSFGVRFIYGGQRWGLPLPRVACEIRKFHPDVVHVVNPACLGIAGILAARWQHRPLVASFHTDLTQHVPHYHLGWLVPLIWATMRRLHGAATLNLATSRAAIDQLAAHGIHDVALWPRGVDLELFRPAARPTEDKPSRPVALYVGRLAGEKGLEQLAPLAERDSGLDLVLVGDGPMRLELIQRFNDGTARFPGILRGRSLAQAYRDADVFVFPSTTETLGLVLLEALASGLPVVAADSPASRELLEHCALARLYPARQPEQILPLARALASVAPDSIVIDAVHQQALQWTWSNATASLLSHYGRAAELPCKVRPQRRSRTGPRRPKKHRSRHRSQPRVDRRSNEVTRCLRPFRS